MGLPTVEISAKSVRLIEQDSAGSGRPLRAMTPKCVKQFFLGTFGSKEIVQISLEPTIMMIDRYAMHFSKILSVAVLLFS